MKKTWLLSCAISSLVGAQPNNVPPVEMCEPEVCCDWWRENSFFEVGAAYSYAWIKPHGNPTFHGNLWGAQALYEFKPRNSIYAGLKFAWRQGKTHQDANSRFLLDFDVEERLGYTFATACDRDWATLFTGFGYRYLGHKLKQPGLINLHFNYNEFYVPVGIMLNEALTTYFAIGLNGVWMPQVFPSLTIIPLNGANWVLKRTLKNFLVEMPLIFSFSCYGEFFVELKPFFEYWQDGRTTAVTLSGISLDVPRNTYLFSGVELNIGCVF